MSDSDYYSTSCTTSPNNQRVRPMQRSLTANLTGNERKPSAAAQRVLAEGARISNMGAREAQAYTSKLVNEVFDLKMRLHFEQRKSDKMSAKFTAMELAYGEQGEKMEECCRQIKKLSEMNQALHSVLEKQDAIIQDAQLVNDSYQQRYEELQAKIEKIEEQMMSQATILPASPYIPRSSPVSQKSFNHSPILPEPSDGDLYSIYDPNSEGDGFGCLGSSPTAGRCQRWTPIKPVEELNERTESAAVFFDNSRQRLNGFKSITPENLQPAEGQYKRTVIYEDGSSISHAESDPEILLSRHTTTTTPTATHSEISFEELSLSRGSPDPFMTPKISRAIMSASDHGLPCSSPPDVWLQEARSSSAGRTPSCLPRWNRRRHSENIPQPQIRDQTKPLQALSPFEELLSIQIEPLSTPKTLRNAFINDVANSVARRLSIPPVTDKQKSAVACDMPEKAMKPLPPPPPPSRSSCDDDPKKREGMCKSIGTTKRKGRKPWIPAGKRL